MLIPLPQSRGKPASRKRKETLKPRNRKLSFVFNELGLNVSRKRIARELAVELGITPKLERFYPGHGWGLKYLAFKEGARNPFAVIKASSSIIERRLRVALSTKYAVPSRRFALEAEVLSRLANIDLGPKVMLLREHFFVREYLEGKALAEFQPQEIAGLLTKVLGSIERAYGSGIFHTDLNAGNVIIRPDGRIGFIDCEVPASNIGEPPGERERVYCHERLLHSLPAAVRKDSLLTDAATRYYEAAANPPLTVARAIALLSEDDIIIEAPQ
jgi:tRNA A-37 threonylcarbamoyl transferase component Bud32